MKKSVITIEVDLDDQRIPDSISWSASDSSTENSKPAKAFMLSVWDGEEKAALRIDLWTRKMMVDEMADFYYQTLMTMADTYGRATNHNEMVEDMKNYARSFYEKFREKQLKENKAL